MKVLVTGTTWSATLAVVHSLARAGHTVVGIDTRELRFKMQSRFLRSSYLLPVEEEAFVAALERVIRVEKPDLLLPVNATRVIVRHQAALGRRVPLLVPGPDSYAKADDNACTVTECSLLGIPAPRVLTMQEAMNALRRPRDRYSTRVVLKPRSDVGGARGVHFVDDAAVLPALLKRAESAHGPSFLQEYIPGRDGMVTVNLLFDRQSTLVACFTMRKLRQWPSTGGISVLAESTQDPDLVETVLPLFRHWRWRGPAEVELKVDPRDDRAKVIEVNPRFPRYIGFPAQCGADFPCMICELFKSPPSRPERQWNYTVGAKYIQTTGYLKSVWQEWRRGGKGCALAARIRSDLTGPIHVNYSEWRDWPVLLAKALTRHRPSGARGGKDVRH